MSAEKLLEFMDKTYDDKDSDPLENREFYELMQQYRWIGDADGVIDAYDAIKMYLRRSMVVPTPKD